MPMNCSLRITSCFFILIIATAINGCGLLAGDNMLGLGARWSEEVMLHDGRKIVVNRSQSYGGRHELAQSAPIKEQNVKFDLPDSGKTVKWKSAYSDDIGRANFNLLAIHVLDDTPYIVAEPNLCLSYNKWGRPNPPYVIFRYDGTSWNQIPLSELPRVFKNINVVINTKSHAGKMMAVELVTQEMIQQFNSSLSQPEYQSILREPLSGKKQCGEMISDGHQGWIGIGWFKNQPSHDACVRECKDNNMSSEYCPCDRLFKGGK